MPRPSKCAQPEALDRRNRRSDTKKLLTLVVMFSRVFLKILESNWFGASPTKNFKILSDVLYKIEQIKRFRIAGCSNCEQVPT